MSTQKNHAVLKGFFTSGLAASASHCVCHPLYTLKNRMMYLGNEFNFKTFVSRSFKEPRTFLYSGMATRAIGIMPEKAMKMQTWSWVHDYLKRKNEGSIYTNLIVAGAFAGAATTVVGCPSERVMVLANVRQQGIVKVVRETGIRGLYKGWTTTLYREYRKRREEPGAFTRVLLGIPAGIIAATAGCPNDVIKTRMQGRPLDAPYLSCFQHFKDIVKNEGPRNLFKGLLPRLTAVPIMMSLFFVFDEELKKRFM